MTIRQAGFDAEGNYIHYHLNLSVMKTCKRCDAIDRYRKRVAALPSPKAQRFQGIDNLVRQSVAQMLRNRVQRTEEA